MRLNKSTSWNAAYFNSPNRRPEILLKTINSELVAQNFLY